MKPSPCPRAGEFAEAVRDQFMSERQVWFSELEQCLHDETLQEADCARDHVAAALRKMDPGMPESQARIEEALW
jgi:hypothetical protein